MALSSAEAEYYAVCTGAAEGLYVHTVATEMGLNVPTPVAFTDAAAAKAMAERNQMPSKVKHMQIRYLHLQSLVKNKRIILKKVGTLRNVSDILTKHVDAETLQRLRPLLNMSVVEATSAVNQVSCYEVNLVKDESLSDLRELKPKEKNSLVATVGHNCSTFLGVSVGVSMVVQASSAALEIAADRVNVVTWMDFWMLVVCAFAVVGFHQVIEIVKSQLRPAAPVKTRTVATQSMTTYTSLMGRPDFEIPCFPAWGLE